MTQTALTRRSSLSPLEAAGPFFNGIDQAFLRRFFEPFGLSGWGDAMQTTGFVPAVDITETTDSYQLSVELPGLTKNDIQVTLENQNLVLSGERRLEGGDEAESYRRERGYGRFSRVFHLPKAVDGDRIKASLKDGVLTLTVPKSPDAQARQIAIR